MTEEELRRLIEQQQNQQADIMQYAQSSNQAETEAAQKAAEEAAKNAEAASKAASEAPPPAPEQAEAAQGAVVPIGPTNRGFGAEESFFFNQRKAAKATQTEVVKHGELTKIPDTLAAHKDMLTAENEAGKRGLYGASDWGSNEIRIDYDSIKDNKQAALFFSTLETDKDRMTAYKQYAKKTGQDVNMVIAEAERYMTSTFDRDVFDVPQTDGGKTRAANKAIASYNLTNAAGDTLDITSATPEQVIQSLHMNPDDETRDGVWKAIQVLQKTPGSRWYGMELTKGDLGFMDSADLTKKEYAAAVEKFDSAFSFSDGENGTNETNYAMLRDRIGKQYANKPARVQQYMYDALDRSYEARTGLKAPGEKADELLAKAAEAGMTPPPEDADEKEKVGFLQRAAAFLGIDLKTDKAEKDTSAADTVDKINEEYLGGRVKVDEEGNAVYDGAKDVPIGKRSSGTSAAPAVTPAAAPVTPAAGSGEAPTFNEAFGFGDLENIGGAQIVGGMVVPQGEMYASAYTSDVQPGQKTAVDKLIEADQPSVVTDEAASVPYDPEMTNAQVLAAYRNGQEPDPRNMAQIADVIKDKRRRDVIDATFGGYSMLSELGEGYKGGGVIANGNKYGGGIASAMDSVKTLDKYDMETACIGALTLEDVVYKINAMVESGAIDVLSGENQYEYALSLPENKALKDQVVQVQKMLADYNKADADAVTEKLKEQKNIADEYRAQLASGNGTPDMLAYLAMVDEENEGAIMDGRHLDDETYMAYMRQMGSRSAFWKDGGEYWSGESAAAQDAKNLFNANGKDEYKALKSEIGKRTKDILEAFSEEAYQNNMTLAEFLKRGGITSVGQIVDIAYADICREGYDIAGNKDLQGAIDKISIGWANAAALGVEGAVIKAGEGIAETTQRMADEYAHAERMYGIRDQFESEFGDEFGRIECRRALIRYANSGELSEESKAELLADLARSTDIYATSAYYLDKEGISKWLTTTANKLQMELEDIGTIVEFLPENERKWYQGANMIASTVTYGAIGKGATLAAGVVLGPFGLVALAPVAGALAPAYGGIADNFEKRYYNKNGSRGSSWAMAGLMCLGEAASNYGGNKSTLDELLDTQNYIRGLSGALQGKNGVATLMTAAKYGAPRVLKKVTGEGLEEVTEGLVSRSIEMSFDVLDKEFENARLGRVSGTSLLDSIIETIEEQDPAAIGTELLTDFGAGAIMGTIFGLAGTAWKSLPAFREARVLNKYGSCQMARKIASGEIGGTEEEIGKFFMQLREDLKDPKFRAWYDKQNKALSDAKSTMSAMVELSGTDEYKSAVQMAEACKMYKEKAAAAEAAAAEGKAAYDELCGAVEGGDMTQIPAMDAALTTWQRAETTYNETSAAAKKAGKSAAEKMSAWISMCKIRGEEITAEDMKIKIDKIFSERNRLAKMLNDQYDADMEARVKADVEARLAQEAEAEEEARLAEEAEAQRMADEQAAADAAEDEAVAAMTDEELDAEIASITEDEARVSEAEAAQEEMGYDEETIAELKAQTGTPDKAARREAIIRNQRNSYKSLTERANQAAEMGDADAEAELLEQRGAVQARLEALGAEIDPETNAPEPSTESEPAKPTTRTEAAATEAEPVSPEPSTQTPPAKPAKYNTPERKETRREKVKDIATGTTKEQRDAAKVEQQAANNISAMDVETFIEENYKDAPEEEKEGIREVWKRLRDRTPLKITGNILEFASRVEKKFGVKIDFVDSLDGERSGEITGNRIKVARDATTGDVVRSVILHELTHKAEGGGKLYDKMSKMILDMKYGGDQDAMNEDIKQKVADYSAYYKAQNRTDAFTDAEAKQEIVADYMGEIVNGNQAMIDRLVRDDYTLAQKIRNIIHDVIDKFTGVKDPQIDQMKKAVRMLDKAIRKADKAQGGTKYHLKPDSWYDYSKPFADQFEDWKAGKIPEGETLLLGRTPKVLRDIGFNDVPVSLGQGHLEEMVEGIGKKKKTKNEDHQIDESIIKRLPELIANPIAIIEASDENDNRETSVLVVFDATNKNANDRQIIGAIKVTNGGRFNEFPADATRLITAHSSGNLDSQIREAVQKEKSGGIGVYYVNKKAIANLRKHNHEELRSLSRDGVINSILNPASPVKARYVERIDTPQFKHWFKGSKAVDKDGNPLILYHGSKATDIDVFRTKNEWGYGGLHLSRYEDVSQEYAGEDGKVYKLYASIKSPYVVDANNRWYDGIEPTAELKEWRRQNGYSAGNIGMSADTFEIAAYARDAKLEDGSPRYDGVIIKNVHEQTGQFTDDYIVFEPTQVKDAEENVGLFDEYNPKRKYSLPSQNALEAQILAWQKAHQAEIDAAAENDGVSRFAEKTIQNVSFVPQSMKKEFQNNALLRNYEKDTNADQLERATQRITQNGYAQEVQRLLAADRFDADDTVEAGEIVAVALENGDMQTAFDMALKYRAEGTEAAKELQSRRMFSKLSPTNLKMKIAGDMEGKLQEHIAEHQPEAKSVNAEAQKADAAIRNLQGGDELKRLNEQGSFSVESVNNRWHVPLNEKQRALIDMYKLGKVARPGIHYNKASTKQRMLEAILTTPDPDANSGNGLTLTQRLEWMKKGKAVVTQADLDYIADQIRQYSVMPDSDQAGRAGDLALARAYEAYGNINPATKLEKARTWRYVSMLLSIPSSERNIIGNSAMNAVNAVTHDTMGVFVDAVTSLFTGKRTKALLTLKERADGWNAFAEETVNTFKDYFFDRADTTPADQGEDRFNKNQRGRVFETQKFEDMRMMEGFLMSVGDRNFWKKAYVNSLAEQARVAEKNGETLDYDAACEVAKAEANYATFNEDNFLRDWLTSARKNPAVGFVLDMIMPFTGVPTNITKRMVEYSPIGLATTFVKHAYRAVNGANFDQKSFVDGLSKALSGSVLYAIGYGLGQLGLINLGTSEEDDEKLYNLRAAMGEQYSPFVRIGDEYVSLSTFAPSVSPIIMGATAYDILKESEDKAAAFDSAMMSAMNQIFDASYMSGLADLFDQNGTPAENFKNAVITSTISQNVPAFMTQTATALDPYVRDTKDANAIMEAVKNGLYARIPGAREELLNPKYDITGQPVASKEGLRNFFDPFTTTKVNDDPVLKELMRLNEATDSSSHIPTFMIKKSGKVQILADIADDWNVNMDRSAGEHKLTLTADERSRYNQMYSRFAFDGTGDTYYETVGKNVEGSFTGIRDYMNSWEYQNATDGERAKEISNILAMAKKLTQSQIVIEKGYRMY